MLGKDWRIMGGVHSPFRHLNFFSPNMRWRKWRKISPWRYGFIHKILHIYTPYIYLYIIYICIYLIYKVHEWPKCPKWPKSYLWKLGVKAQKKISNFFFKKCFKSSIVTILYCENTLKLIVIYSRKMKNSFYFSKIF